ncbi:DUF4167 domain-containing protein [Martelella alba]|uniref:DUF4167 domain-containing protein n=1 Tax=Martelella alba TaxID=2590451 RepID=A0A506UGB1_9HYPH|nr:DUF4167 domain-containing protein [Martelella alba]TPW32315.1 DUF4167 domain-containing protein [Martelella alba]
MRPGQQNKRSRGRGNNNNNNFNRKGANPLTRTYDSSGPDVKIRGTAQHIAEKYLALARDAQGSGDRVMAENYLQHAEHYNRIIASAQAQLQERYQRDERNDGNDSDINDDDAPAIVAQPEPNQSRQSDRSEQSKQAAAEKAVDADGPQPVIEGTPAEVMAEEADGQPVAGRRNSRRRTPTGARPRRTKRGAESEGEAAEGAAEAEAAPAAEAAASAEGEAEKKPARRRRTRKDAESGEADKPEMAEASSE